MERSPKVQPIRQRKVLVEAICQVLGSDQNWSVLANGAGGVEAGCLEEQQLVFFFSGRSFSSFVRLDGGKLTGVTTFSEQHDDALAKSPYRRKSVPAVAGRYMLLE